MLMLNDLCSEGQIEIVFCSGIRSRGTRHNMLHVNGRAVSLGHCYCSPNIMSILEASHSIFAVWPIVKALEFGGKVVVSLREITSDDIYCN